MMLDPANVTANDAIAAGEVAEWELAVIADKKSEENNHTSRKERSQ